MPRSDYRYQFSYACFDGLTGYGVEVHDVAKLKARFRNPDGTPRTWTPEIGEIGFADQETLSHQGYHFTLTRSNVGAHTYWLNYGGSGATHVDGHNGFSISPDRYADALDSLADLIGRDNYALDINNLEACRLLDLTGDLTRYVTQLSKVGPYTFKPWDKANAYTGATAKATTSHKGKDGAPDWTETRHETKPYIKEVPGLPDRFKWEKASQCSRLPLSLRKLIGTPYLTEQGNTAYKVTLGSLSDALRINGPEIYRQLDKWLTRSAKTAVYVGPDADQLKADLIAAMTAPPRVDYITPFSSEAGTKGPRPPKHTPFSPINHKVTPTPPIPTTFTNPTPIIEKPKAATGPPARPRPTAVPEPSPEVKSPDGPPEPVQAILDGPTASTEATMALTLDDIKRLIADLDPFDLEEVTAYANNLHSNN